MSRSVYVAGGSSERLSIVRPMIDRLIAAGVEIAYDWTRDPGWEGKATPTDLARAAHRDLDAVRRADLVWYMAPADKSEGSASELGMALALNKRVIASGPFGLHGRIFPLLCARYDSHEAAAFVVERAFGKVNACVHPNDDRVPISGDEWLCVICGDHCDAPPLVAREPEDPAWDEGSPSVVPPK